MASVRHISAFDGLRGYAIISVLLFHVGYGIFPGGYIGVDLFFVVSGYLITSLLHEEYLSSGTISFSKFYARRAIRLFPPLIVAVILANVLWPFTELPAGSNRTISTLSGLFYFTNMVYDYVCGNLPHLWSLAVEEHFYLVWPLTALFVIFKTTDKKKYALFVGLVLLICIFRIVNFYFQDQWSWGAFRINPYEFTLCRIDGIILGALLYFLVKNDALQKDFLGAQRYANIYLVLASLFFVGFCLRIGLYNPHWMKGGFMITNLASVFTVFIAVSNPNHKFLSNKLAVWIGKRSYGIYAYHYPVFIYMNQFTKKGDVFSMISITALETSLSIIFAVLSYNFIEKPILKLKGNFKPNTAISAELQELTS